MSMNKNIAVIGGDKRQVYLCRLLALKGYHIYSYQVEPDLFEIENVTVSNSLEEIMNLCDLVIGPIPFSRDGIHIFSNTDSPNSLEEFVSLIRKEHIILGGNINTIVTDAITNIKARYYDFMKDDSVAIKNAVATAEGTILEAIRLSDINIANSQCLVLGFGRCAKVLANRLKALQGNVTIAARNKEQIRMAQKEGYMTVMLKDAKNLLSKFDFIFNTIPALIITPSWLSECNREVVIIDIASKPGGTDFEECKRLGIKATLALGLPGKYAPKTSAEILIESIEHLLP